MSQPDAFGVPLQVGDLVAFVGPSIGSNNARAGISKGTVTGFTPKGIRVKPGWRAVNDRPVLVRWPDDVVLMERPDE